MKHSRSRLQEALQYLHKEYHYIFLDCPPNITLVSENIFRAADLLLLPVIPTTLSMLSYQKLCRFFEKHGYDSEKLVAFFSMVENRKKLHRQLIEPTGYGELRFLQNQIPYSAEVEKMGLTRRPLLEYRPHANASLAYGRLWEELKTILKKIN